MSTSSNPLRVAIPNRVTKPTREAIEIMPPVKATENTPPTKAKGKLIIIMAVEEMDLTERYMMTVITTKAMALAMRIFWVALSSASN